LPIDTIHDITELSAKKENFIDISSASEEKNVSLGSVASTSVTPASTTTYNDNELQSDSSESK
jgi:hypothetical protein